MLISGLAILNSSEAKACPWPAMSCRTTARLMILSPTRSLYWAGRICWFSTLTGQRDVQKREWGEWNSSQSNIINDENPSEVKHWVCRRVNLPSMGASCMTPWVSQKVFRPSAGLWLYSLAWALRFTFIVLVTLCLFMTLTVKEMGSPATGALSRFRKTSTPSDAPAE